ncbi:hypothetical protein [Halorussus caseinilyticus]|uniref:Uncharacterized protein n=1 Tax=Halorussus caseinilyticus TaxID=3034025 RepID=A0ABD5WG00_9EURY|nr:hypothetical protein [Halorussus sp. DT72]
MSLTSSQVDEIEYWTGRLLAIAGVLILIEAASGAISESLRGIPFAWLLTSIPFGIGFVLLPLVLLRSYQYLSDRTPTSAIVGVALVAALPVGTVVIVAWAVAADASGLVPDVTVLPVRIDTVFFTLLAVFAGGIATFGLSLLRYDRTRLLGGALLMFGSAWNLPLVVVGLSGVYPGWLSPLLVASVATTMIAIGYCFPLVEPESR